MIIPSPAVMDHFVQHQRRTLNIHSNPSHTTARGGVRVRFGRLLIAAGSTLSGEPVERPGRPTSLARSA